MSKELERHKAAVQVAITGLRSLGLDYAHLAHAIEERINEALNPKPEMEEVEVVRWECKTCGEMFKSQEVSSGNACCWGGDSLVKLTGTLKRPKPQPVERTCPLKLDGNGWAAGGPNSKGLVLDRLPISGFFTWTEDPK